MVDSLFGVLPIFQFGGFRNAGLCPASRQLLLVRHPSGKPSLDAFREHKSPLWLIGIGDELPYANQL